MSIGKRMNPKVHIIRDIVDTLSKEELQELCTVCGFSLPSTNEGVAPLYDVRLVNVYERLRVAKKIKELVTHALKEAVDLMDASPCYLKQSLLLDDAVELAMAIQEQGADLEVINQTTGGVTVYNYANGYYELMTGTP